MKKVNTGEGSEEEHESADKPVLIADFWDTVYFPHIKENLRHSTVKSYEKIWEKWLKAHFTEGRCPRLMAWVKVPDIKLLTELRHRVEPDPQARALLRRGPRCRSYWR